MFYGAALAGGKSQRMGTDKAALILRGHSLLANAVETLKVAGAEKVLLSGTVEKINNDTENVPDLLLEAALGGPPLALYSIVEYIKSREGLNNQSLLIIPVDMPGLNAEVLINLVNALGGENAVYFEKEVFPCGFTLTEELCEVLKQGLMEEAKCVVKKQSIQRQNRFSMKQIFSLLNAKSVAHQFGKNVFSNINTPDDWQKFNNRLAIN